MKLLLSCSVIFISLFFWSFTLKAQPTNFNYSSGHDSLITKNQLIVRSASKDTLEISALKNGQKHGKQILFFPGGKIQKTASYKNGLLNGKMEYFQQHTKDPIRIEHYKAFPKENTSKLHGITMVFSADGKLLEKTNFKNGAKNGKYEWYHSNGTIREKGTFKDNLNIDRKLSYSVGGILLRDENYILIDNPNYVKPTENKSLPTTPYPGSAQTEKISVLHGSIKYFYNDGRRSAEYQFKNGQKDGVCREYFPDQSNSLKSEMVFKEGKQHGAFEQYNSNGNLEKKGIYYAEIKVEDTLLKNVYDGKLEIYQQDGKLQRIENWKNYKKNGFEENYNYHSGKLSERSYYKDNLKTGILERFDQDGVKNYEAFFEIITKDGQKISQQTGTQLYWEKGILMSETEFKNGLKNGLSRTYYPDGQLKKKMFFKDDKLDGDYRSYHENGQLREEFNKKFLYSNSIEVDWNTVYDDSGKIVLKFFNDEKGKRMIEHHFKDGKRVKMDIFNLFRIEFYENQALKMVAHLNGHHPDFGYQFFRNKDMRKVFFGIKNFGITSANFTSEGRVNQMRSLNQSIEDKKTAELALRTAEQYNPEWEKDPLLTDDFPNGKYHWKYADGNTFFEIEMKEDLPHGKWIFFNPVNRDTLFYQNFEKGLPVEKTILKKADGTPEKRLTYFANHQVKKSIIYDKYGNPSRISRNDSLGNQIYGEEYLEGGIISSKRNYVNNTSIYFSKTGDTLHYKLLKTGKDSVMINRQFYDNNKIKLDRKNNFTTGKGYTKSYYENGALLSIHELENDQPHGAYRKYDEDGNLLTAGHFKEGKRDGKWTEFKADGQEEITFFKNGELSIPETESFDDQSHPCKCFDTSLPSSQIGFANSLKYMTDYRKIKSYFPENIIPIDELNYDKIYFINFRPSIERNYGSVHFKLLLYQDFSFYYPLKDYLKINLNPCQTSGYIGNMDAGISFNSVSEEVTYAQLSPRRISVSLAKNPLIQTHDKKEFTAFFDTKTININEKGIESIIFPTERNECFPPGIINNFMEIQINSAELILDPTKGFSAFSVPLLVNENKHFYGFEIDSAQIHFDFENHQIKAESEKILAGGNFVAGKIFVKGKTGKNQDEFILTDGDVTISPKSLQKTLERNHFFRVKIDFLDDRMTIEFYAEK